MVGDPGSYAADPSSTRSGGQWDGRLKVLRGSLTEETEFSPEGVLRVPNEFLPTQELFLPVTGFVQLSRAELGVLAHPAMQRLRWVNQIGLASIVFPGVSHTRLEHSIGTLGVATQMLDLLEQRHRKASRASGDSGGQWILDSPLTAMETTLTRLGALLHDVGHVSFGHTLEDELGLLTPHDSEDRLDHVFERTCWNGQEGRSLRAVIDLEYGPMFEQSDIGLSPTDALRLLISSQSVPSASRPSSVRWQVCRSLIADTLCADLLDYLYRDRYHMGMPGYLSLRVASYLEIRRRVRSPHESRLVVNLQTRGRRRTDAITELLAMLQLRHELFEVVFYHRAKLAATAMLERALSEHSECMANGDSSRHRLLDLLLDSSDIEFLGIVARESGIQAQETGSDSRRAEGLLAVERLLVALRHRRLHKPVFDRSALQLPSTVRERIRSLYAGGPQGASNRLNLARLLEDALGMARGALVIYCPDQPRGKIAAVDVLVDDAVRTLQEHENLVSLGESTTDLTAGMLQAQQRRFAGLWRILVSADPRELARLGVAGRAALDEMLLALLGVEGQRRSPEERGVVFANELAQNVRSSPLFGRAADIDAGLVGAHRGGRAVVTFPDGTPVPTAYLP